MHQCMHVQVCIHVSAMCLIVYALAHVYDLYNLNVQS